MSTTTNQNGTRLYSRAAAELSPLQNVTNFQQHKNPEQQYSHDFKRNCPNGPLGSKINDDENRNLMVRMIEDFSPAPSMHWQRDNESGQYRRDFDMSQSLIVAKTTTCTEFLQLENFNGHPCMSACDVRAPPRDSRGPG